MIEKRVLERANPRVGILFHGCLTTSRFGMTPALPNARTDMVQNQVRCCNMTGRTAWGTGRQ